MRREGWGKRRERKDENDGLMITIKENKERKMIWNKENGGGGR